MNAETPSPPISASAPSDVAAGAWRVVDRALEWAGDRLNPILVKETRQALKSRQFTITFTLLLLFGWVWSILGVAIIGPDIYYTAQGSEMFAGYYLILAVPLFVIVPFGAFRSLAGEQEDRTYELMSITTLGPRQIIRGKLGSAVLQMLIYLSAISPCLAFTYMLRGIDFPTILFILAYTIVSSLGLALIGLLLGTLTAEKHWQVVLSVVLIGGLLLACWIAFIATVGMLQWAEIPFGTPEFWQICAAWLTGYASYFLLLFYAAAAQITFASDNRSTRLRAVMLMQHVLLTGWMAWVWLSPAKGEEQVLAVFMVLIGLHWYGMGTFMSGEMPQLSPRVKRQLPQSFLGRMFLTWFNPGPGTGYIFAIANLVAALVLVLVAVGVAELFGPYLGLTSWARGKGDYLLGFGVLGLAYVVLYLGVGLSLVRLLRKFASVGIVLSVLLQILLLLVGLFVPLVVQWMSPTLRNLDYTWLHVFNPVVTLAHMVGRNGLPAETPVLMTVVPAAAVLVLLLTLPGVAHEVRQVRIAKPKRVAEEDVQQAARRAPPQPTQKSPWD